MYWLGTFSPGICLNFFALSSVWFALSSVLLCSDLLSVCAETPTKLVDKLENIKLEIKKKTNTPEAKFLNLSGELQA
jgi:hypothetical protein